ncbi:MULTISPECIES: hypothetical protein [unclassified Nocardioides]|uniref:hypothetical protein n=1 Tax=unclassified Nocardioides TaxID=2615069 RepID=UPI00301528BC
MSYGVIGSKSAHLLVETTAGAGGSEADLALDRLQERYGAVWIAGRITLTRLHLGFVPTRLGRGLAITELHLRDVTSVEIGGGRVSRVVGIGTARHVVRVRTTGAQQFAQAVAQGAEDVRRTPRLV